MTSSATRGPTSSSGTNALRIVGMLLAGLGAVWWSFDANPGRGKVLLVAGLLVCAVSRVLKRHLSPVWKRVVLVVAAAVALLVAVEAVHLVEVINEQRAAHLS